MKPLAQLVTLLAIFTAIVAFKIHDEATADMLADFLARLDEEMDGELSAVFREAT